MKPDRNPCRASHLWRLVECCRKSGKDQFDARSCSRFYWPVKIPIILDMETGDPDDCLTLLLLIGHPRVDLQAVTVTPGSAAQIGIVRHIVRERFGLDIPIGAHNIAHPKDSVSSWHYRLFGVVPRSQDAVPAGELLLELCDEETTLVTGAPLKNLGSALALSGKGSRREFTLGRWVGQGGFAGDGVVPPELQLKKFRGMATCPTYNLNGALSAARAALAAQGVTRRLLVSKNVCHDVVYDAELHERVALVMSTSPTLRLIHRGMSIHLQRKPDGKKLHDPLAACCAIDEGIGVWAEVEMYREGGGWGARPAAGTRTSIIIDYDHDRFIRTLLAPSPPNVRDGGPPLPAIDAPLPAIQPREAPSSLEAARELARKVHGRAEEIGSIRRWLKSRRSRDADCTRIGWVVGPRGVGRSTLLAVVARDYHQPKRRMLVSHPGGAATEESPSDHLLSALHAALRDWPLLAEVMPVVANKADAEETVATMLDSVADLPPPGPAGRAPEVWVLFDDLDDAARRDPALLDLVVRLARPGTVWLAVAADGLPRHAAGQPPLGEPVLGSAGLAPLQVAELEHIARRLFKSARNTARRRNLPFTEESIDAWAARVADSAGGRVAEVAAAALRLLGVR